jgi:adenylate cyclase
MESVNDRNRARGLPWVEMGVGVATGDVILGNIGSEQRTKYGVVGTTVNLAARIESYTLGGEVLICDQTQTFLGDAATIDLTRRVHPKGFEGPIDVHRVVGIKGDALLTLPAETITFEVLREELPVQLAILEGKQIANRRCPGFIWAYSAGGAKLRCQEAVAEMSDIRLELIETGTGAVTGVCYAKVVEGVSEDDDTSSLTLRFATRSAVLEQRIEALLGR